MFKQFVSQWIWSGIDRNLREREITPVKITNTIALVASLVLLMQIPVALLHYPSKGPDKLYAIFALVTVLGATPVLNRKHRFALARALMIGGYLTYIFYSSLALTENLNHHYFLLLGIFVCPFLFYRFEEHQVWPCILTFALVFISLDLYWSFQIPVLYKGLAFSHEIRTSNAVFFTLATLLCSYQIRTNVNSSRARVSNAHEKSDAILRQALPAHVIANLQGVSGVQGQLQEHHRCVSVVFADLAGYTTLCRKFPDHEVVIQLNILYSAFDQLCDKFGLMKIKTNGDQYMAVAGINSEKTINAETQSKIGSEPHTGDHSLNCATASCHFAMAMLHTLRKLAGYAGFPINLRVGIATGQAVAGIIGRHSISYDIWGDTVNLAARMESEGLPGKIQVCPDTYQRADKTIKFCYRGELNLKGIGKLPSYLITP